MRIASPPITHPDFYGIDTPEQQAPLAANHSLDEMRDFIGVASLASSRSMASTGRSAMPVAIRQERNSPTIASPATIRRR